MKILIDFDNNFLEAEFGEPLSRVTLLANEEKKLLKIIADILETKANAIKKLETV